MCFNPYCSPKDLNSTKTTQNCTMNNTKSIKNLIRNLLHSWENKEIPDILPRDYNLDKYSSMDLKKIIAVTGFRRSGKTYLMFGIIKKLLKEYSRKEVIYINFEDERIPNETEFLTNLIPAIRETFGEIPKYLFLDEIQNISKWGKWVRRIYDNEDIMIYVSGSSSKMSSKEIPTELRGRFLEVNVFPLSFGEFLKFNGVKWDVEEIDSESKKAEIKNALNDYLEEGGLPEIVLSEDARKEEIAQSYFQTVVAKDIVERFNIKDESQLKSLLKLLLNSTEYSISKLYKTMKSLNHSISKNTINKYLNSIKESYFMFSLPIFSYKIKDRLQYPRKAYFIDNIFINSLSTKFSPDRGRLYENTVAVTLLRKDKKFFYWRNKKQEEIDFVVKEGQDIKKLIQVCCDINREETKKREIRPLLKSSKELGCKNLLVITRDYEDKREEEWFGTKRKIKYIPLWKYLLQREQKNE